MIVDEDGREVPRGTIGEIVVRGPIVMQGYWNKPEETAKALRGGWLHTGDAAIMDDEGLVYIVDRLKDMIISGGENVYSTEVENAISVMPEVAEVSVIGIPDPKWGEAVHAIVVPRNGAAVTAEAVQAHCRTLIAAYKCPRSVELRSEPLPVSAAGKIQKNVLREPYWREQGKAGELTRFDTPAHNSNNRRGPGRTDMSSNDTTDHSAGPGRILRPRRHGMRHGRQSGEGRLQGFGVTILRQTARQNFESRSGSKGGRDRARGLRESGCDRHHARRRQGGARGAVRRRRADQGGEAGHPGDRLLVVVAAGYAQPREGTVATSASA